MSAVHKLITDHLDIWTAADTEKKSGRGRASGNANSVYGIKKLRELILELAVRGKLVPQDPSDEPALDLLKRTNDDITKLVALGELKAYKKLPGILEKDEMYVLPDGWVWERLGNLATLENGDRGKNYPNKATLVDSGVPFVNAGHLQNGEINKNEMTFITREHFDILRGGKFRKNDILFCLRGSLGKTAIVSELSEGAIASSLVIVRLFPNLDHNYFCNFFDSALSLSLISQYDNGTAQPNLSSSDLGKFLVPIPPLAEQHRIVAKVDELMALCDQLEAQHNNAADAHEQLVSHLLSTLTQSQDAEDFNANWQRIATHFDTLFTTESSIDALKQTLLQLAVMGKLVPQDPNDEPASELLKRIQVEKAKLVAEGKIKKDKALPEISEDEKPFRLPVQWEWVKFDQIVENSKHALKAGPFGSALKKDMYCENGYKIYGQEQVISGDENFGDYYINEEKYQQLSSCSVKSGDILISLVGTIGRVLALSEKCQPGIINPRLVKISLFKDLNRSYMKIIFASPLLKIEMQNKSHGGTMDILNLGLLRDLALPLPPVEEQQRIVVKVNELSSLCKQLKWVITSKNLAQRNLADVLINHSLVS